MRSILDHLAYKLFAVAIAIRKRGIDEVQAEFECAAQSPQRFIIRAAFPLFSADAPGAIANFADLEASPAEFPVSHELHGTCRRGATRGPPKRVKLREMFRDCYCCCFLSPAPLEPPRFVFI